MEGEYLNMKNEEYYINKAREYAQKNPSKTIYDFIEVNNYYNNLSEYDKKHYIKSICRFFPNSDPDSIQILSKIKD